ncbi:tetratricopeptide repeat protein [Arthrobacter sp. H-02-3]|uniref:tetratricopeptide repeat protein n=1 Tax=Arthrobacter sp. H-02-3 TaxID=2703675 RepID=UPI0010577F1B|nr:tetratricopeptide repeat protein [Arthrobacter sp. H-02-3]
MALATAAEEARNHDDAIGHLRAAVEVLQAVRRSAMRDVWLSEVFTRLGDTLRLAGRYGQASEMLAAAYQLAEQNPKELLRMAAICNAQGILAKDTGHFGEAEGHYAQAQLLTTQVLGPDTPEAAGIYHNVAGLLHVQGPFDEAEPAIRTALELRERADPPDPVGVAADTSVLGAVLAGQERLPEAEAALQTALRMWQAHFGPDHYEVAVQLHNLAAIQQKKKAFAAAEAGYLEAFLIKERVLGEGHPEIAALLNNLASLRSDEGRTTESLELYDRALAIFGSTLGPDHPNTKVCEANRLHVVGPARESRLRPQAEDCVAATVAMTPNPGPRRFR